MEREQQNMLNSWSVQRDNILNDISVVSREFEQKVLENKQMESINNNLKKEIEKKQIIIDEIISKEERFCKSISTDIVSLQKTKDNLSLELQQLEIDIEYFKNRKKEIESDVKNLLDVFNLLNDKYGSLNVTVDNIMRINQQQVNIFNKVINDAINKLKQL